MIFWSHMGQDAFRLAVEHKIGKMGSDWIWLFSFTSFEIHTATPGLLTRCCRPCLWGIEVQPAPSDSPPFPSAWTPWWKSRGSARKRQQSQSSGISGGYGTERKRNWYLYLPNSIDQIPIFSSCHSSKRVKKKSYVLKTIWHHILTQSFRLFQRVCYIYSSLCVTARLDLAIDW